MTFVETSYACSMRSCRVEMLTRPRGHPCSCLSRRVINSTAFTTITPVPLTILSNVPASQAVCNSTVVNALLPEDAITRHELPSNPYSVAGSTVTFVTGSTSDSSAS